MPHDERQSDVHDLLAAGHGGDGEAESVVNVREDLGLVLKVVECGEPPRGQCVGEEGCGRRIRCQAGWRDDATAAGRRKRGTEVLREDL